MKLLKTLPVITSLTSLCCGFVCILYAIEKRYDHAAWLIVIAMVFDTLDGKIARFTKTDSAFGEQLDSLIDLVVFGVAPAVLVGQVCGGVYSGLVWIACFCYLSATALRLAKFNVMTANDKGPCTFYTGLPSTISGGTIAHLVLLHNYLFANYGVTSVKSFIPLVTLGLGLLMISRFKFFNIMAKISLKQGIFPFGMEIGGAIVLFCINPRLALSVSLTTYVVVCGFVGLRKKENVEISTH